MAAEGMIGGWPEIIYTGVNGAAAGWPRKGREQAGPPARKQ